MVYVTVQLRHQSVERDGIEELTSQAEEADEAEAEELLKSAKITHHFQQLFNS